MMDIFGWLIFYIMVLISVITTFVTIDYYKERKNRRD